MFNQNATGALGELPVTPPEIWVRRDADLGRASGLISAMEAADQTTEVPCPVCNESNPVGFDICWQCAAALR